MMQAGAAGCAGCFAALANWECFCLSAFRFLQDYRGFSRTGKPKVLVMSYPCFRGHKAEVYKLGIDVLMCDEV